MSPGRVPVLQTVAFMTGISDQEADDTSRTAKEGISGPSLGGRVYL